MLRSSYCKVIIECSEIALQSMFSIEIPNCFHCYLFRDLISIVQDLLQLDNLGLKRCKFHVHFAFYIHHMISVKLYGECRKPLSSPKSPVVLVVTVIIECS